MCSGNSLSLSFIGCLQLNYRKGNRPQWGRGHSSNRSTFFPSYSKHLLSTRTNAIQGDKRIICLSFFFSYASRSKEKELSVLVSHSFLTQHPSLSPTSYYIIAHFLSYFCLIKQYLNRWQWTLTRRKHQMERILQLRLRRTPSTKKIWWVTPC